MLLNLLKAATAVVVTPFAVVVDTVMFIPDACSYDKKRDLPYSRTGALLKAAGEAVTDAVTLDK
jgi:hypothetical protein